MKSIREWIKENFPHNDNWDEDNCFFFSLILRERFEGKIYYDVVNNYFITKIGDKFYDYNGEYFCINKCWLVDWEEFQKLNLQVLEKAKKEFILKEND